MVPGLDVPGAPVLDSDKVQNSGGSPAAAPFVAAGAEWAWVEIGPRRPVRWLGSTGDLRPACGILHRVGELRIALAKTDHLAP